ncbi:sugar kinase [Agromyces mediolanus]|uniref:Sugar kinase n=1 Tax=Agromyces mediolanus TaxID=41986 RepID=A0A918CKQ1_AGRME|nr:sugar kinase [Agromyces mediolanus]GGR29667.1 sugar kinase [Agromyces mediolanus]GLJ72251.1 sugar kinase [Agromyces mediolanus]
MPPFPEVLTVGETMALVVPARAEPLESAVDFRVEPGGAESNVAAHLAALGRRAAWAGAVGDDPLGRRLLAQLDALGVDTSWAGRDPGSPTGVYFKNPGDGVHYYRTGSAASRLGADTVAGLPVAGARLLHLSGITPALSASCEELVDALFAAADAAEVPVSFDVNHRPALWPSRAAAAERLLGLARRARVVFVGLDEAEGLWGTSTAESVRELLPEPAQLIVKDGAVGATEYSHSAPAAHVPATPTTAVEVVGAGDAFAAGWIAAWLDGADAEARLAAGHARAVLTIAGTSDVPREEENDG